MGAGVVDHSGVPVGCSGTGGLYPVGGVVLLVSFARVNNRLFLAGFVRVADEPGVLSQRSTTPGFGWGSWRAYGCLIPRPQWVGLWVAHFTHAQTGVSWSLR